MSDTEWTSKAGSEDWLAAERAHEYKMAELAAKQADEERNERRWRREQWTTRVGAVTVGLTIATIVLGIVYAVWSNVQENRTVQERIQIACIEQGGTWTSIGSSNAPKGCYKIGEVDE